MESSSTVLIWLQEWLRRQNTQHERYSCCIEIETIGTLGWYITVHVEGTPYETKVIPIVSAEYSDTDWYYYRMYNAKYEASGDPEKLEFLLKQFKNIIEQDAVRS